MTPDAVPGLNRDRILRAALGIVDAHGIEALSMRRLGTELGVDPMAVYYYVPNKSALFDGVVGLVHDEINFDPDGVPGDWRDLLTTYARRVRAVLGRHAALLPVFATRPNTSPAGMDVGEKALARLASAGFPPRAALQFVDCLRTFTVGHALAEHTAPVGAPAASEAELAAAIRAAYPTMAEAISGGNDPDEEYELGLRSLLDGFALRLR